MQLNLKPIIVIIISTWLSCLSTALAQDDQNCYDAVQHPVKFSDLGTRSQIAQALNETCELPVGDYMYKCNAAVSVKTDRQTRQTRQQEKGHTSLYSSYIF